MITPTFSLNPPLKYNLKWHGSSMSATNKEALIETGFGF